MIESKEGYKNSEIGLIPEEWKVVELENVLTIQRGASPRPIDKFITENKKGVNWIKIGDIKKDAKYIIKTKQKITIEGAKKSRPIQPKDFILSNSMSFGRPYISKIDGCIHDGWLLLRNKDENILLNNFLYEVFSGDLSKKQFKKFAAGSTVNNLKSETVSKLKIPLPPLKEQKKIADILSTTDSKIDSITSQIEKAERLKKGLLQKLLSEGIGHNRFKNSELGKIPESWKVTQVKELINNKTLKSVQDGNHGEIHPKSNDYVKEGIPFVMANNLIENQLNIDSCNKISKHQYNNLRIGYSFSGDVLLTHKATIGLTAIVPLNTSIMLTPQVTAYSISNNKILFNLYLYYYFQTNFFQTKLKIYSKQSTRSYIGITAQKKLFILIPPFSEQKEIANILSTADEKIEILRAKKEKYEIVKKGLLQKLLSGELRTL